LFDIYVGLVQGERHMWLIAPAR